MLVTLYKTDDAQNVINKTLTEPVQIEINFKSDVDKNAPDLILSNVVDFSQYNYCYISGFETYYFINNRLKINYHLTKLLLEPDYLETYKAEILTSTGTYRKRLEVGDYGQLQLNETGEETVSDIGSSVQLVDENQKLLTVLSWSL